MDWTLEAALEGITRGEHSFVSEVTAAFDHARRIQQDVAEHLKGILPSSIRDDDADGVSASIGARMYTLRVLDVSATLLGYESRRASRLYVSLVLTVCEGSGRPVELLRLFVNKYHEVFAWTAPLAGAEARHGFSRVDDDPKLAVLVSLAQSLHHPCATWALVSKHEEFRFPAWDSIPIAAYAKEVE